MGGAEKAASGPFLRYGAGVYKAVIIGRHGSVPSAAPNPASIRRRHCRLSSGAV